MAVKRVPLGLTLEQHQQLAFKLHNLWKLVYGPQSDKTKPKLCGILFELIMKLAYELAEFVYLDLKGTGYNPTKDDPYDGWDLSPLTSGFSFQVARTDLVDLREKLLPTNPQAEAVKLIDAMLAAMGKVGV